MAGLWYRVGTVSVTNGSKKVTGFGSQWKSTVYKPDKGHALYGPDGQAYEIDYVESDTVLYLVLAYAGATADSQAYSIDITRTGTIPAFSRELSAQLAYAQSQYDSWQQILTGVDMVTLTAPDGQQVQVPSLLALQPKDATLTAMAGVATSADKVILFTGQDAATAMTVTAAARNVLDDTTTAAMRVTLGAAPGGCGLGEASPPAAGDLDTVLLPGWVTYNAESGSSSGPSGFAYGSVLVASDKNNASGYSGWASQMFFAGGGLLFVRNQKTAGSMAGSVWQRVYAQNSILGSVSQSGGAPTGAIIEQGSNANGQYVKFADGTLICRGSKALSTAAIVDNDIGLFGWSFYSSAGHFTFPAVFSASSQAISISAGAGIRTDGASLGGIASIEASSVSSVQISAWAFDAEDRYVSYTAVGRWY